MRSWSYADFNPLSSGNAPFWNRFQFYPDFGRVTRSILSAQCAAELYRPSPRPYRGLDVLEYPSHDRTVTVMHCGRVFLGKRKINLSHALAGQNVGIKEVADQVWLVTLKHDGLGFFDYESGRLEPIDNPVRD
jgi:putative transposase